jgi:indolepyruvate ferredoxin oxidoreductase beta subunit
MKHDSVLCGVGGQGVVSLGAIIARSAASEGLHVKQVELHGMAQRGGMVVSQVRISDETIHSNQIPLGTADMILGLEPMEALRNVKYLCPRNGICIASSAPVVNIPDYPQLKDIMGEIESLPRSKIVDSLKLAEKAGSRHTTNMVMLGAASVFLPLNIESLLGCISERFKGRSEDFIKMNQLAFELGRTA